MNTSLPILSLTALGTTSGASVPDLAASASGSDDNAFFETLTAALAAGLPIQPQPALQATDPGISVHEGPEPSEVATTSLLSRFEGTPAVVRGGRLQAQDAESLDRAIPSHPMAAKGVSSLDPDKAPGKPHAEVKPHADIISATQDIVSGQRGTDSQIADIDHREILPSAIAGHGDAPPPQPLETATQAGLDSSSKARGLRLDVHADGLQPEKTGPVVQAAVLRSTVPSSEGGSVDDATRQISTSPMSLADQGQHQHHQAVNSERDATAIARQTPAATAVAQSSEAHTVIPAAQLASDRSAAAGQLSHRMLRDSETPLQAPLNPLQDSNAQALAGRSDVALTGTRPSLPNRRTDTSVAGPTVAPYTTETLPSVEPGREPAIAPIDKPRDGLRTSALDIGSASTPTVSNAEKAVLPANTDIGPHQATATQEGVDRLQYAPPLDAGVRDIERPEAAANLNASRPQTPTPHPSPGNQIALQIIRHLPDGVDRLSVHLQPADLGSVDIQLTFDATGKLSALISAERPETLELLQRDGRLLERSLGDSGLKLSSDGLSFSLKQEHQQHQQHGQSFHEQARTRQASIEADRAYDGAADPGPATSAKRIEGLRLLDIRT